MQSNNNNYAVFGKNLDFDSNCSMLSVYGVARLWPVNKVTVRLMKVYISITKGLAIIFFRQIVFFAVDLP